MRFPALLSLLTLPAFSQGTQSLDTEFEGLYSSDIDIWTGSVFYELEQGDWSFSGGFGRTDYSLLYQPVPTLGGTLRSLSGETWQTNLSLGNQISPDLNLSLGLRAYDGFADYRSIWIAEYYRQTFNFPGSGYLSPDPGGWALNTGLVWNPRLESTLGLDLSYGRDSIAPGWTFGSSSADLLSSYNVRLRWEESLNPRLKTETSLTYSDISQRDPRILLQSSWNFAASDQLTLRAQFGAGKENPSFESVYTGITLDYELNEHWSLALSGRIYDDSGEIENSGFNTAAPGLRSYELGLSALYQNGDHAIRASLSLFQNNYDPVDPTNDFFANLYRDRDWTAARLAYSLTF
ncbi:MAG: hypothetical protein ACSHYF_03605 [Verrucomicrobiaceae bacterium]